MKFLKSLEKWNKNRLRERRRVLTEKRSSELQVQLKEILNTHPKHIPVIIISYNNGVYVHNSVIQLNRFNITPIVIDNASTSPDTVSILKDIEQKNEAFVIRSTFNFGHMVGFIDPVYNLLPEVFAYTDPDLQFNESLPDNFLAQLESISRKYKVFKAGFALTIDNNEPMIETGVRTVGDGSLQFEKRFTVREWEQRFWQFPLKDTDYELYGAEIDTTFAIYVKSNYDGRFTNAIRVGGNFSALHLPWFPNRDLMSEQLRKEYLKKNISSTWVY